MANAAIAYLNYGDSATLSVSTQELTMPVLNLQNVHVERRWRSMTNADYAIFDLGALTSIDTLAILGTTMTSSGVARARISSADPTGVAADLYDSGDQSVDDDYNSHIWLLPAAVSGRYVRFDISDPSGTFIEAGRAVITSRNQFTINFAYNWSKGVTDRSNITKTRGGQTQVWVDNKFRTLDLSFNFLTETERNSFIETIDLDNGLHKDVLFIINPDSANLARDSIWGLMKEITPVVQPLFDRFSKRYEIEERL